MHPVEEKMALWRRRRPRCTTARDSANSEGGIEKHCKPPSGGLEGKIALKIWQFGHFKKYENCISDVFSNVVNSLPEYWKPDISHPNWLSRLKKQKQRIKIYTAWKASKYGVISGPSFSVFRLNTEIWVLSTVAHRSQADKADMTRVYEPVS